MNDFKTTLHRIILQLQMFDNDHLCNLAYYQRQVNRSYKLDNLDPVQTACYHVLMDDYQYRPAPINGYYAKLAFNDQDLKPLTNQRLLKQLITLKGDEQ